MTGVLNVRGDKGGALVIEVRRFYGLYGHFSDRLVINTERFKSRFFKEGTCSGRAGFVHRVIRRDARRDMRVLRVLSAYFKYSVNFRVKINRGCRVGYYLVYYAVCYGVKAGYLPARACYADIHHVNRHIADVL